MNSKSNTISLPRLRHARAAVVAAFVLNGILVAMWAVSIPTAAHQTGVDHGVLGGLLLLTGVGAFIGMQATGPIINHAGSRATTIAGGILLSAAILLPIFSTSAISLGIALFFLGFSEGVIDVSQNSQAIAVERLYRRPILSTFHAWFSVGGAAGAISGSLLLATGMGLNNLYVAGVIGAALTVFVIFGLLPRKISERKPAESMRSLTPSRGSRLVNIRLILILGALAFVLMLVEGTAANWSSLQITEHLHVPGSLGALGYAFFAIAMTIGRFRADRVTIAIGPRKLVRYGALVAAIGLLIIILSPQLWLTFAGWALLGIGLSGCVPQIFTAAGAITTGKQGTNVARVVGLGYLGFLAGPALIGGLAQLGSVTLALILPGVLCLVASLFAFVLPEKSSVGGNASATTETKTSIERS